MQAFACEGIGNIRRLSDMQKLNISYEPPKKKIYGSKRFVKAMVNYLRKSILQSTVFLNFLRQCINALFL